jgi:hypothetical protein
VVHCRHRNVGGESDIFGEEGEGFWDMRAAPFLNMSLAYCDVVGIVERVVSGNLELYLEGSRTQHSPISGSGLEADERLTTRGPRTAAANSQIFNWISAGNLGKSVNSVNALFVGLVVAMMLLSLLCGAIAASEAAKRRSG